MGAPPYGVNSGGIADSPGLHPSFANPFVDISTGASIPNKFPFTSFPQPGSTSINWAVLEPFGLNTFDRNFTTPYSMNFNLNVEREFPANTVLSLGYIGALGRHLYRSYDANPITAAGQANCLTASVVISGKTFTCVGSASLQHLLFPQDSLFGNSNIFGGVGQQHTDGTSHYNALQANVTKGMTHGLSLIVSYTWSHAIDNGSGLENSGFGGSNRGINLINPALNVGDSAFDARQRFVIGYNYAVPSLHHLVNWAPDKIFGGWKMTGITTFQTGFAFSLLDSNPISLSCDALDFYACSDNPNQVKPLTTLNPRNSSFSGTPDFFFDPSTFAFATAGTFGNTRRGSFHGPGINNTDFALLKDTKFTERTMLEVGIEGYNLFNHTQFCTATNCVVNNIRSPNFGRILAAAPGRLVQLRAKISF